MLGYRWLRSVLQALKAMDPVAGIGSFWDAMSTAKNGSSGTRDMAGGKSTEAEIPAFDNLADLGFVAAGRIFSGQDRDVESIA